MWFRFQFEVSAFLPKDKVISGLGLGFRFYGSRLVGWDGKHVPDSSTPQGLLNPECAVSSR